MKLKLGDCDCQFDPEKGEFEFCLSHKIKDEKKIPWTVPVVAIGFIILYMLFCFYAIPIIFGLD